MAHAMPNYKERVLDALPGTVHEIAKAAKVALRTARRWLALLMRPGARQVRIVGWLRQLKGPATPQYGRGAGPCEPRPTPYTNAERCRQWAAGLDPDDHRWRRRAEQSRDEGVGKADYRDDPLLSWIPSRAGLEVRV